MLLNRNAAAVLLCAATVALVACTGDNPAQSDTPSTGTPTGGVAVSPFDDIARGAASLQQAAGMAEGAKSPALTTVAPLQQAGAGYRSQALTPVTPPAPKWETEGLFETYFEFTAAQEGTGDSGTSLFATSATYTTYDQADQEVERGTNMRALGYQQSTDDAGNPIVAVAISEQRKATTSTRRAPGTYGLSGAVAMHERLDYLQVSASFLPLTGGASSSIQVTYAKVYEPSDWVGTFEEKLAHRGAKISEQLDLKGSLATGESLDLTAKRAGTATAPTRSATASIDLGGDKGKVTLASDLTLEQTTAFPSAIAGSVSISRQDKGNAATGQLYIDSFTPRASTYTVETTGELRDPQGGKVGTFTGTIDLRANQWLGVYQQTGQASKSINLTGLLSQLW